MRSASRSASADSLSPHVRRVRLMIVAVSPDRRRRSGRIGPLDHLLHLVGHAGHGVDDLLVAVGARHRADEARRRAPPLLDDRWRPSGTSAWRRLLSAIVRPRDPNIARITLDHRLVAHERDAHHRGDGVAGDVVLGRAEAAAADHGVAAVQRDAAAPRRCGRGCRRPWSGSASRSRPGRAARRSTTSWCRRSARAAARCRWRRLHSAWSGRLRDAGWRPDRWISRRRGPSWWRRCDRRAGTGRR